MPANKNKPKPPQNQDEEVAYVLPSNVDAERFVLGSILLDHEAFYAEAAAGLKGGSEDFSLTKHQKIFSRMVDLYGRGEKIDRVTVANELSKHGELEAVDGLSYLVSLDDGLPQIPAIDAYVRIVKEKAALRRLVHTFQHGMNRALMAEDESILIAAEIDGEILKIQGDTEKEPPITPYGIITSYPGGVEEFMDPSKQEPGIPTGLTAFDNMTAGFQAGDLVIIGARPSMGKTALCLNIAEHVTCKLKDPKRAVVFSLEMSKEQNLRRMMCSLARVDYSKFRQGYLSPHERQKCNNARNRLVESPLLIDDTGAVTLMDMRSKLKKIQKKHGPVDLVIVDYLQLMGSPGRVENRNQEVSAQTRGLKLLAKEMKLPVVALSQLSRAVETRKGDHRPQLSDLRDSGSIEQDADLVAFVFREEVYRKDCEDIKGLAELIIAKARSGPTGTANVVFLHTYMRFDNKAEDWSQEHGD